VCGQSEYTPLDNTFSRLFMRHSGTGVTKLTNVLTKKTKRHRKNTQLNTIQ